jgi:hypothetical protein
MLRFLSFCFMIAPICCFSQQARSVLSQQEAEVGEKITLTYLYPLDSKQKVSFTPQSGTLTCKSRTKSGKLQEISESPIEIQGRFNDTLIKEEGQRYWVGVYEIITWDTGMFLLPGPTLLVDGKSITLPDTELISKLVEQQKNKKLFDIKEGFADVPETKPTVTEALKSSFWWIVALVISAAITLWYFLRNKQPKPEIAVNRETTLSEKVLLQISALEEKRLWEKEMLKEHYTELSFIIRTYLSERYQIQLLERTTNEARLLLKQLGLHDELLRSISSMLNESDLVKFAKSKPTDADIQEVSDRARSIVNKTTPPSELHA